MREPAEAATTLTTRRQRSAAEDQGAEPFDSCRLMVGIMVSVVAHSHTPHARCPIYKPRRLPWDEHEADLEERACFRRYYRIDIYMQSFHKLAELLRLSWKSMPTTPVSISVEGCHLLARTLVLLFLSPGFCTARSTLTPV